MSKFINFLTVFFLLCGILQAQSGSTSNSPDQSSDNSPNPEIWRKKIFEFNRTKDINYSFHTESRYTRYSVFGDWMLNLHKADFRELDSLLYPSCCPNDYGAQTSYGFSFGAGWQMPFWRKFVGGLNVGFVSLGAELSKEEDYPYSSDGVMKDGISEHIIDAKLSAIVLQPLLGFRITENIQINIQSDLTFLISRTFDQKEVLKNVENYTFENGKKERNVKSGDIPNANTFLFALGTSVSYEVPLNKTGNYLLAPELGFMYGLSDISSSLSWKVSNFRAGLSFRYSPNPTIDTVTPEIYEQRRINDSTKLANNYQKELQDSINIAKTNLLAKKDTALNVIQKEIAKKGLIGEITKIEYLDDNGTAQVVQQINIEQFIYTKLTPLHNSIYFEKGQTILPDRYKQIIPQDRGNFNINNISTNSSIDIYYDILNIVGKRMATLSDAQLKLIAYNIPSIDNNDSTVAQKRAETISYYLQNVWKIPSKNIIIEVKSLTLPSNDKNFIEENRIVKLMPGVGAESQKLFSPVFADNKTYNRFTPETLKVYANITSGAGIKQWGFKISDEYANETSREGTNVVPEFFEFDLQGKDKLLPEASGTFALYFFAIDSMDKKIDNTKSLKVEVLTTKDKNKLSNSKKYMEHYELLFELNESELSKNENQEELNETIKIIKENKPENTECIIIGRTDKTGTMATNRELSNKRSQQAAKVLDLKNAKIISEPKSREYNNLLPEGRVYNRSVLIEIMK